jgi:hypothetical protein
MNRRSRQLISLIALAVLIPAASCQQTSPPAEKQLPARNSNSGSSDQAALVEALVALLLIAGKRARDGGECDERAWRPDATLEERALKKLLCERFSRQEPQQSTGSKKISTPPKG